MRRFYEAYRDTEIVLPPVTQIQAADYQDLYLFQQWFELKVDRFRPEYLGQLNFYLEALDRDVKKPHENPSIGILLCKDQDAEVVKYGMRRSLSPAMVTAYQTHLPDKEILRWKMREIFGEG